MTPTHFTHKPIRLALAAAAASLALHALVGTSAFAQTPVPVANSFSTAAEGANWIARSELPPAPSGFEFRCRTSAPHDARCPVIKRNGFMWVPFGVQGSQQMVLLAFNNGPVPRARLNLWGLSDVAQINVSGSGNGAIYQFVGSVGMQQSIGVGTGEIDNLIREYNVSITPPVAPPGAPPTSPAGGNYGNDDLARMLLSQPNTVLHAFMTAAWLPRAPRETRLACSDSTCPVIFYQNVLWVPYTRQAASNVQLYGFKANGKSAGTFTLKGIGSVKSAAISGSTVTYATGYAGQGSTASVTAAQLEAAARKP